MNGQMTKRTSMLLFKPKKENSVSPARDPLRQFVIARILGWQRRMADRLNHRVASWPPAKKKWVLGLICGGCSAISAAILINTLAGHGAALESTDHVQRPVTINNHPGDTARVRADTIHVYPDDAGSNPHLKNNKK